MCLSPIYGNLDIHLGQKTLETFSLGNLAFRYLACCVASSWGLSSHSACRSVSPSQVSWVKPSTRLQTGGGGAGGRGAGKTQKEKGIRHIVCVLCVGDSAWISLSLKWVT